MAATLRVALGQRQQPPLSLTDLFCGGLGEAMIATDLKWIACRDELPPVDVVVMTKIDDADGCRNETTLKRYQRETTTRSLWFYPDGSMYVYYEPTHWAAV